MEEMYLLFGLLLFCLLPFCLDGLSFIHSYVWHIKKHFFIYLHLKRSQPIGLNMYVQIEIYITAKHEPSFIFTVFLFHWIFFHSIEMTYISCEIQHDRNLQMLQQWSAYHYWHLTNVHHLEKKFESLSWGTHVIMWFYKLTVHWNGANKTSVFTEITKCLQCQQNLQVFVSILWKQNCLAGADLSNFFFCLFYACVGKPLKHHALFRQFS